MAKITLIGCKSYSLGNIVFEQENPVMTTQEVTDEVAKELLKTGFFELNGNGTSQVQKEVNSIKEEDKKKYSEIVFVLHHISSSEGYGCLGKELVNRYLTVPGDVRDNIDLTNSMKVQLSDISTKSNIIQMCAGDLFKNYKMFNKSVGYTMFETTKLSKHWAGVINENCDLLLVPAEEVKKVFVQCGVKIPVKVVPLWVHDMYQYIERPKRDTFTFLWAGKLDGFNRKGALDAVEAFKAEFKPGENARLIIKATTVHLSDAKINEILEDERISFVKGVLNEKEFMQLFKSVDCFVFPTHGEGFGLPPLEAMATGLPTIISDWMGCSQFIEEDICYPIKITKLEKAFYPDAYGDVGDWAAVDTKRTRKLMRHVFENREEAKEKGKKAAQVVNEKYRFKNFDENLREAIDAKIKIDDSVSIVIAIKDNLLLLKQCLKSIYLNTDLNFELIIVDNDSGRDVKDFLVKLKNLKDNVKIITNDENLGYAYACNQGLKIAENDYICMLDADTIVGDKWLSKMMETFYLHDNCGIVTPSQSALEDMNFVPYYGEVNIEEVNKLSSNLKRDFEEVSYDKTYGFCHVVKKSVFEKIGSYDWKRYLNIACNETDLFWRASLNNFKIYWAKGAYVYHYMNKVKESLGQNPFDMVQKGKRILEERKNHPEDFYVRNDVFVEGD